MRKRTLQHYQYHVWANRNWFKHLAEQPPACLHQPIDSVFPTLHQTLIHLLRIDQVWIGALSDASYEQIMTETKAMLDRAQGASLAELETLYEETAARYVRFIQELEDVEAVKDYAHPTFGIMSAPYSEIVQHVVNHGTYHRGNLTAMLRQLGHAGVPTDYAFYLYEVYPKLP